jgi:glycosyltransferase involved in cell wall biosynthesis
VRSARGPRFVLYCAVLPRYRREVLRLLSDRFGADWLALGGAQHLDATVRSDGDTSLWRVVSNHGWLGRRLLFQWGSWPEVMRAEVAILDLNPRSITAGLLLFGRRLLGRRTLVWGHLNPRLGPNSRTAAVRSFMRHRADGCVVYAYADADAVTAARPDERVWVAPNALYRETDIHADEIAKSQGSPRAEGAAPNLILCVGRLERDKKPQLLLEAFALLAKYDKEAVLCFVGQGRLQQSLVDSAAELGVSSRVRFDGPIDDVNVLRSLYAQARCSVSPGYCGLSLTQSMCFGVPMLIASDEPHAPEIELTALGLVAFFAADSAESLASALAAAPSPDKADRASVVDFMRASYSAEAMASGLADALLNAASKEPTRPRALGVSVEQHA